MALSTTDDEQRSGPHRTHLGGDKDDHRCVILASDHSRRSTPQSWRLEEKQHDQLEVLTKKKHDRDFWRADRMVSPVYSPVGTMFPGPNYLEEQLTLSLPHIRVTDIRKNDTVSRQRWF